jgi:hypothetical protein
MKKLWDHRTKVVGAYVSICSTLALTFPISAHALAILTGIGGIATTLIGLYNTVTGKQEAPELAPETAP